MRKRIDLRTDTGAVVFSALTDPKEKRSFVLVSFTPYNNVWWTERWGLKLIGSKRN